MGTVLVRQIIADVSKALADEGTVRQWPQTTLLNWLNYAEKAVCMVKPDAYQVVGTMALSDGTLQDIPAGIESFGRLTRNMGDDGHQPGIVIREMSLSAMDQDLYWHMATPGTTVEYFIRIPDNVRQFYIFPPIPIEAMVYVEYSCPGIPPDLVETNFTTGTVTINLPDSYKNPLFELVMFRAFDMLSSNIPGMQEKANICLSRAIQMLTGKNDAEAQTKARSLAEGR